MKAEKELIVKAAQLGILRSMPDFLEEPLKPGRLKRKFMKVSLLVDTELRNIRVNNPDFFIDNTKEIKDCLSKFGAVAGWTVPKEEIHVASVVAFCMAMLDDVKNRTYVIKIIENLKDIVDYYDRVGNITYSDMWNGNKFRHIWDNLNEIHPK